MRVIYLLILLIFLSGGNVVASTTGHAASQADGTEILSFDITDPGNAPPEKDTVFELSEPMNITTIATYHYNHGKGTKHPGNISIMNLDGQDSEEKNTIHEYATSGHDGKDGEKNAYWLTEPGLILPKGTYRVIDSDNATWSKDRLTGMGIALIWGTPVQ